MAVHLGVVGEDEIDNMSYIFFEDVIEELGHKLVYDAVVNYAGNSFCENSCDMISENNPMSILDAGHMTKEQKDLMRFLEGADVMDSKGFPLTKV